MTDYERGLRDASLICRDIARQNVPFTMWRWDNGIPSRSTRIARKERARAAIRCARHIEKLFKRET